MKNGHDSQDSDEGRSDYKIQDYIYVIKVINVPVVCMHLWRYYKVINQHSIHGLLYWYNTGIQQTAKVKTQWI